MTADEANAMSGKDPDFATRDLYNAIAEGDFPKWYFCPTTRQNFVIRKKSGLSFSD
jgi:catalase